MLQNVLKKQAADKVINNGWSREIMKGWLIKTKNGRSRRVWCVLLGKVFMYYRRPSDKVINKSDPFIPPYTFVTGNKEELNPNNK